MDIINNENKKAVILGDRNIDLLKYDINNMTNMYLDNIISRCFVPKILRPTRITATSPTLIDHIYSNIRTEHFTSGILINDVADHLGIFYSLENTKKSQRPQYQSNRIFSEKNMRKFNAMLEQMDFTNVYEINCAELSYNTFFSKIH